MIFRWLLAWFTGYFLIGGIIALIGRADRGWRGLLLWPWALYRLLDERIRPPEEPDHAHDESCTGACAVCPRRTLQNQAADDRETPPAKH